MSMSYADTRWRNGPGNKVPNFPDSTFAQTRLLQKTTHGTALSFILKNLQQQHGEKKGRRHKLGNTVQMWHGLQTPARQGSAPVLDGDVLSILHASHLPEGAWVCSKRCRKTHSIERTQWWVWKFHQVIIWADLSTAAKNPSRFVTPMGLHPPAFMLSARNAAETHQGCSSL